MMSGSYARRRGFGQGGGNGDVDGKPPCGARCRVRTRGRHMLGVLGHVRPAAHGRLRDSGNLDHVRAHGHRSRLLPCYDGAAQLEGPSCRVPRLAVARPDSRLCHFRRAAHPDELPLRHRLYERRRGHHDRAGGACAHHALRMPAVASHAAHPRGARTCARPRRHAPHRDPGGSGHARHSACSCRLLPSRSTRSCPSRC